ncbi:MAG: M48 family metallopeptidase [Sulfuricella sp.]|nr:M48 family metallopeptidase [Sulfuricella sp.]
MLKLFFIAFLLAVPQVLADGLPDLGDVAQADFSPQMERKLGETIMAQIRRDQSLLNDAELTEYLNNLGYRLVSASPDSRQDFEFFVIKDASLNAFALPGGYIGVHTGLILAAQSESELAAVLGHEIAHVTQRHLARMIEKEKQSMWTSLAAIAVAILASRSNPQMSNAAMATAQATSIQNTLNFTRDHEREADRVGLQIMSQAGFDARGAETFFERLQRATRLYDNNAPDYLRTHPVTSQRIADIQNRLEAIPYRQTLDSFDFHLMRAKLRAMDGTPAQAVAFFEDVLRDHKYAEEAAQHYGLAAALLRQRQYERAEGELARLRKLVPPHPAIESLAAQIKLAAGKPDAALAIYRSAMHDFPDRHPLIYGYAEALLQTRRHGEALKLLASQVQTYPNDVRLYRLQAEAYAAQGKRLLSHQAQGEAYYREGNLSAAIDQLQIAQKSGDGDFYQLSMVEARLRQLRAQDRDNKAKNGGKSQLVEGLKISPAASK